VCGRLILHFVPTKLRNIEEEGTKDSDLMCIMLVGVLFFCLETKEKIPKEKLKAALPGLLR